MYYKINKQKFEHLFENIISFLEGLNFLQVYPFGEYPDCGYLYAYKDLMITPSIHNDLYRVRCFNRDKHITIDYNDLTSQLDVVDTIFDYLYEEAFDLLEDNVKTMPAYYQEQLLKHWAESNGYDVKDANTLTAYIKYINSKEVK